MNLLLDTHFALWCLYDSSKLNKDCFNLLSDPNNDIYVSSSSIWEISNKHLQNPKAMPLSGSDFYEDCLNNDFYILPVQAKVMHEYEQLTLKQGAKINKDPFDRILVAQAKYYKYLLVTHDHCMKYYNEPYILYFDFA